MISTSSATLSTFAPPPHRTHELRSRSRKIKPLSPFPTRRPPTSSVDVSYRCRRFPLPHIREQRLPSRRIPGGPSLRRALPTAITATLSPSEMNQDAAKQTVDLFVRSNMTLGLGSGEISNLAVKYIGEKIRDHKLQNVNAVPMSVSSASIAAQAGIKLLNIDEIEKIDFAFTDADEIEEGTNFCIIGQRENFHRYCILTEKSIIKMAKECILFVSEENFIQKLNGSVPILIQQDDWLEIAEEVDDIFLGDAEVWRRPTSGEADPMGGNFPLVTPSEHYVLDLIFSEPINALEVVGNLEKIPGVEGHGFILDHSHGAAVASKEGVKFRTALFRDAFI